MKISYNWLKNYLNTSLDINSISKILTDIGLEVESLTKFETIKGGLQGVIVGEVISCIKHPNADKLSVTLVDIGNSEPLSIVCGAPNVAAKQKVLVATVGTILYNNNEPFEIKKSKIRGIESNGMICAEDELGLGASHEGILILPIYTKIGLSAIDLFNIESDTIIEIGLTPNRIDAASHIGVARDLVAALKSRNIDDNIALKLPDNSAFKIEENSLKISVDIESDDCIRYSGLTVSGVEVKESPEWLQNRLKSIGLRPLNNIVDITNFILFEYGQPLHAFDTDKIVGGKIIVKKLPTKTEFIALDGAKYELCDEDLMICNASSPMCIAGVFGGLESGVTNKTKNIFIESACFGAVTIRKTSKRHSLQTDASFRYERGSDPNITIEALKRAAILIKDICGGKISSDIIDVYPKKIENKIIDLDLEWLNNFIGKQICVDEIISIVELLFIKVVEQNANNLKLSVPPFKVDVNDKADIAEEILRIYGYNKIIPDDKINISFSHWAKPDNEKLQNRTSDFLCNNGFNEMMCNSFTASHYYLNSQLFNLNEAVKIFNPLSKELDMLRITPIFSGLEAIEHNINRKRQNLKLFEFGKIYKIKDIKNTNVVEQFEENRILSLFLTGNITNESWREKVKKSDFFSLKAIAFQLLENIGIGTNELVKNNIKKTFFAKGETFFENNREICSIGQLNKAALKIFEIEQNVFYAEIYWDNLLKTVAKRRDLYNEVSKFPEVRRDLALELNSNVEYSEIITIVKNIDKKIFKNVNLFDIYEGDKIGKGKKSYAISIYLQDNNKTLTDKDIDKFMSKLIFNLEKNLNVKIRK